MKRMIVAGLLAAAVVGCAETKPDPKPTADAPAATGTAASPDLLRPLVMATKPDKVLTVWEAHDKKEGETVVVTGTVPPDGVKPFNPAVATFILMAPEDLAREDIKEEFACDDAATCPGCRALLDKHGVRVELVDGSGAPLPTTVEGFAGLKPGSTVTVEGQVKRDGKNKKAVRIVATKFYPG